MNNHSMVTEIFLLGFQHLNNFKILTFSLILLIYLLTTTENALVIALVTISQNLHSPMFFFLLQLSLSDLLESMVIVPILLITVLNEGAKISLIGCIAQLYLFGVIELYTIYSDDCSYTRILQPKYPQSFLLGLLSSSGTFLLRHLLGTDINNHDSKDNVQYRKTKSLLTCSSHLAVVSLFYGSLISIYLVPTRNQSQTIGKLLSLLYTVVTPCINPVIYSLKSTDIKNALKNIHYFINM
ncbi:hypothetical protein XELAEV_18000966mg [Xenopus laevis]|nr:hypothetical protein XELAEV_18000966mg [Xenopus laevis]